MIIREADTEDYDILIEFYTKMNEIINVRTNKYNPNNPIFPSPQMVCDAIKNRQLFVGIEDGIIAIACIVNNKCDYDYRKIMWQIDAKDDEFWVLHALRVLPEYEGRGFAKSMLMYIIDLAPVREIKSIRLDVLDGYEVEKLYSTVGFKYIDTTQILYEDIGHPMNFKLLERVI